MPNIATSNMYCHICEKHRVLRSKHCKVCNQCIPKYDHHCPWTGKCIGELNYKYFLLVISILSGFSWLAFFIVK